MFWYHQDLFRIAPGSGRSGDIRRRYAELAGLPVVDISGGTYTGTASQWSRTVIEPDGVRYVYEYDQSAVWIDVRDSSEFGKGSIPGARNLPRSGVLEGKDVGEVFTAKNDGRLPMEDHNTRIIVFGQNGKQASEVAEALAREAFHNVAHFAGTYEAIKGLVEE